MVAVRAHEVGRVLERKGADARVFLFYGTDAGLISERARGVARGAVDDPEDPFQLVRLDGERLAEEPGLLVEEASTYGLFGGRRAVLVRAGSRPIAPAVEPCLAVDLARTVIVIEAGDLNKANPLRQLCERAPTALALPCYPDEGRDLGLILADALRAHGLEIDPAARDLLLESLGGNRLSTRSELDKLCLYLGDRKQVRAEDVEAAVSDVSGFGLSALVGQAFRGDVPGLELALSRAREQGIAPAALLSAAQRQAWLVLAVRIAADRGAGEPRELRGLLGTRRDEVLRQSRRWPPARLKRLIAQLQQATLDSRTQAALAPVIAERALLALARNVRPEPGRLSDG